MGKLAQARLSVSIFVILILFVGFNWYTSEKARSFEEPSDALLDLEPNLLIIPGYKKNNVSLYFFMKESKKMGATFLEHGIFGWKTEGNLLYTTMGEEADYLTLDKYVVHDDYFVYGLVRSEVQPIIKVNGKEATLLNLNMLDSSKVKEYRLENMYIWYVEDGFPITDGKIEMINKETKELITTTKLDMKKGAE
ncbi:hypothetical protein [Bacillus sp. T3]|uniref:hypothetical protein n=1 Tax=Bacillus sp. T3 TaxID=467262 RepID=UPI002982313B|nr:hypothetical protein [Bacillus sp. T3]